MSFASMFTCSMPQLSRTLAPAALLAALVVSLNFAVQAAAPASAVLSDSTALSIPRPVQQTSQLPVPVRLAGAQFYIPQGHSGASIDDVQRPPGQPSVRLTAVSINASTWTPFFGLASLILSGTIALWYLVRQHPKPQDLYVMAAYGAADQLGVPKGSAQGVWQPSLRQNTALAAALGPKDGDKERNKSARQDRPIEAPWEQPDEEFVAETNVASKASETSKASEPSKTAEASKVTEDGKVAEASKVIEASETNKAAEASKAADTTEATEVNEANKVAENSEATDTSDSSESSNTSEASPESDASEAATKPRRKPAGNPKITSKNFVLSDRARALKVNDLTKYIVRMKAEASEPLEKNGRIRLVLTASMVVLAKSARNIVNLQTTPNQDWTLKEALNFLVSAEAESLRDLMILEGSFAVDLLTRQAGRKMIARVQEACSPVTSRLPGLDQLPKLRLPFLLPTQAGGVTVVVEQPEIVLEKMVPVLNPDEEKHVIALEQLIEEVFGERVAAVVAGEKISVDDARLLLGALTAGNGQGWYNEVREGWVRELETVQEVAALEQPQRQVLIDALRAILDKVWNRVLARAELLKASDGSQTVNVSV